MSFEGRGACDLCLHVSLLRMPAPIPNVVACHEIILFVSDSGKRIVDCGSWGIFVRGMLVEVTQINKSIIFKLGSILLPLLNF